MAIEPTSRGFGYAVLEEPASLIDWGVMEGTRTNNRDTGDRVETLLGSTGVLGPVVPKVSWALGEQAHNNRRI